MFPAALFVLAPNCPSPDEWTNKPVHPSHGLLLSNKKKQTISLCTARMELKAIMLSEKGQSQMITYCIVPFSKRQNYSHGEQISGCRVRARGGCDYIRTALGDLGGG